MLSVNSYPKEYVDACRARTKAQVAAYRKVVKSATNATAITAFEPVFFNNMLLVLDESFMHRSRNMEGKDGNPMNEVRVLCNSILQNDGVMAADKTIRMKAERTVLQYDVGDEIRVSKSGFLELAEAFFAAIESTYP